MSQSPTALVWPYPLSSPSARFTRMNNYVRSLDVQYAALSGAQKSVWKQAAIDWPWLCYCLPDIYDFPEAGFFAGTGLQAFRTVNCTALDNGLPVTVVPPVSVTGYDGDQFILTTLAGGLGVLWTGRSSVPVGTFYLDVRLAYANNIPGTGPAVQKFSFSFVTPVIYDVPVLLFPTPTAPPPPSMIVTIAGVAVGQTDAGPFYAIRLPLI